jgi:hypothetical protein
MRWISVKEDLPKGFMSVLVYIPSEAPLPTVHEGYYANGQWFCKGIFDTVDQVTHWAEMPSPPED